MKVDYNILARPKLTNNAKLLDSYRLNFDLGKKDEIHHYS